MDILNDVTTIMKKVFRTQDITVTEATVAGDIEKWTSITHISLVVEVERFFKIKFKSLEIQKWTNVGDMMRSIEDHLSRK
jgi:acyl carrier protein